MHSVVVIAIRISATTLVPNPFDDQLDPSNPARAETVRLTAAASTRVGGSVGCYVPALMCHLHHHKYLCIVRCRLFCLPWTPLCPCPIRNFGFEYRHSPIRPVPSPEPRCRQTKQSVVPQGRFHRGMQVKYRCVVYIQSCPLAAWMVVNSWDGSIKNILCTNKRNVRATLFFYIGASVRIVSRWRAEIVTDVSDCTLGIVVLISIGRVGQRNVSCKVSCIVLNHACF